MTRAGPAAGIKRREHPGCQLIPQSKGGRHKGQRCCLFLKCLFPLHRGVAESVFGGERGYARDASNA